MSESMLNSLNSITRVSNGYASVQNVLTRALSDIMPSFFLAETCKYLYLTFDPENLIHQSNHVFTTEGHILPINRDIQKYFSTHPNTYQIKIGTASHSSCAVSEPKHLSWESVMKSSSLAQMVSHCLISSDRKVFFILKSILESLTVK